MRRPVCARAPAGTTDGDSSAPELHRPHVRLVGASNPPHRRGVAGWRGTSYGPLPHPYHHRAEAPWPLYCLTTTHAGAMGPGTSRAAAAWVHRGHAGSCLHATTLPKSPGNSWSTGVITGCCIVGHVPRCTQTSHMPMHSHVLGRAWMDGCATRRGCARHAECHARLASTDA